MHSMLFRPLRDHPTQALGRRRIPPDAGWGHAVDEDPPEHSSGNGWGERKVVNMCSTLWHSFGYIAETEESFCKNLAGNTGKNKRSANLCFVRLYWNLVICLQNNAPTAAHLMVRENTSPARES